MHPRFKAYIGGVSLAAVLLGITAVVAFPIWPSIAGPVGVGFWVVVVALGASNSVRMPGGTIVDVSTAPLIACLVLGGPPAAALAAAIGLFEIRELRGLIPGARGGVPWYGSIYNHSAVLVPAVL